MDITVKVHSIAEDGLPDMDRLTGRVAFIWDGAVVSGWPVSAEFSRSDDQLWEPSEDRFGGPLTGVTHWLEFPVPVWELERSPLPHVDQDQSGEVREDGSHAV